MPQSFRSWVRNAPEPYAYVLSDGSRILLGKGAKRYAAVELSIKTKDPDSVDAVNKDGEVIRTHVFRGADGESADDEPNAPPPVLPALPASADASLLLHFSSLIAKAYSQGAQDHAAAYTESHKQVVNLCNGVLNRCQALERLLNQMLRDVRRDAIEAREELEDAREERLEAEAEAANSATKEGPASIVEAIVKTRVAAAMAAAGGAGTAATGGDK